jgi:hypothetical protein
MTQVRDNLCYPVYGDELVSRIYISPSKPNIKQTSQFFKWAEDLCMCFAIEGAWWKIRI